MERNSEENNTTRRNAGINSRLADCYLWPPEFGSSKRKSVSGMSKISEESHSKLNQMKGKDAVLEVDEEDNTTKNHSIHRKVLPSADDKQETASVRSVCSRQSNSSSVELQRRKHAVEVAKIKQAIEMKKLEDKLQLLELEQKVFETQVSDDMERSSGRSLHSSRSQRQNVPDNTPRRKMDVVEEAPRLTIPDKRPVRSPEPSDIERLCHTISEAVKSVGSAPRRDRFIARQVVEKDILHFDGNPEEWTVFITQFRKIASLCEYSSEEMMIILQKCLKGEAKLAVSGMMISPDNVDSVLKILEMRFGRPDLIIDGLISKIKAVTPIREHNIESLIKFSNHISCLVATIKSLGYNEHLQNPTLVRDIVQKLPDMIKLRWGEEVMKKHGTVDLNDLSDWISDIAAAACYVSRPSSSTMNKTEPRSKPFVYSSTKRYETTLTTVESKKTDKLCTYCREKGHYIQDCSKINQDDVETRWETVTRRKLCFSCLKNNHQTMKCRSKRQCGIDNCKRSHHKLLHKDQSQQNFDYTQSTQTEDLRKENVLAVGQGAANILLRMIKVRLYGKNDFLETIALCDEASTVTLIDKSIVDHLEIEGNVESLCIQWTNNMTSCYEDSHRLDLDISGIHENAKRFTMKNVRSVENLSLPVQVIKETDWKKYPHLQAIPFNEIQGRPMILLGQDNIRLTVARRVIQGPENSPLATKTNLGWILHGDVDNHGNKRIFHSFHICHCETVADDELHKMVKHSFSTEAFGVQVAIKSNKEDSRAIDIMQKTAKRIGDRFEIGLLWRENDIHLPESKNVAARRLMCVEKQMHKDENFKRRYCEKIESYLRKGYARKLSAEEASEEGPRCWYLPHFGVINPNKPAKLRLVFDAASKSCGTSLNENLLAGPDLLQPLVEVLIKFRQQKITFCSDVREMFHQVKIITSDQCSQRFLWREGNTEKPHDVYEMQVMTFGATCSPTCAQFVKNLNARQLTQRQDILDAIEMKHYVDDYLDCTDTVDEALEKIFEVKRIQNLGGFELVDWTSNSKDVMDALSTQEDFICKDLDLDSDRSIQRILGLSWDSKLDSFCFKLKSNIFEVETRNGTTKRQILKIVMSIFDPLGLIANLTVRGRILIQDIWKSGIGWDDSVEHEQYKTWKLWLLDLQKITNISIPRCYSTSISKAERVELHIFCDASKRAYASVAYLRMIAQTSIDVSLIFARARVAPNKPISIPRLELQAALMGSRLKKMLIKTLEIKIDKTYLWTDSTTVLHWIKNDGSKLGQFESHRVGEIQESTDSSDWHWVPSKSNAADNATRTYFDDGNNLDFNRWHNGPEFLQLLDEMTWPIKKTDCGGISKNSEDEEDIQPIEFLATILENDSCLPDINRFSKWMRLIRATAWVLVVAKLLISKLRSKNSQIIAEITTSDLEEAEIRLIKQCQLECFPEEISFLKKSMCLKNQSRLKQLSPVMDKNGVLVVSGRTDLATQMEMTTRRPIILPSKHRLTKLLLHHYHEQCAHQGIETVLNTARQKFWIIDGRSAVKTTFAECKKCQILKAKPAIPQMGQLPTFRLTPPAHAFTYTGIDYFGPLYVTVGRRREKRWGVIFTCLSIRAVHLEVAHSLSTESTLMAVRRMIARRGQPLQIYSDNGTNFRGSSEELKKAVKEMDKENLKREMLVRNIEWKFIPPASPHMGGAWERLVRSVKTTFHVILNNQILKDELLLTLFAECEKIVNSRPITKVSVDPDDLEALTPNHFLLDATNYSTAFESENGNLRGQWRRAQELRNSLWKRWTREYLPTLTKRTKWRNDGRPMKLHDIVIVIDDTAPRKSWKLGLIEKIFPGPDGKIRVVQVKTANGSYKRPVAKLCRLDIEDSGQR
ncbi:uncharacterized protein LOC123319195 [Coccinella septempunctata]|uniref:uncharacterized protein LOC123319195 n=1 Tax=Coccinella septempunctata TaxID=41139 RepID=UPI001D087D99|nr:uncharacterized protein LOC123319195 [Coccinella septempunctata]